MGVQAQDGPIIKSSKSKSNSNHSRSQHENAEVENNHNSDDDNSEINSTQINFLPNKKEEEKAPPFKLQTSVEIVNEKLFTRNVIADTFYLVLRGKVSIVCGKEEFNLEIGSFSSLGSKALLEEEYKPDFSARVIGEAKLLKITRAKYLNYLK